ncbi:DUF3900 domain-containing protein [Cohnella sp. CFH 77786]|uniref:DUF3900 domain-containing protein n=1 Tax=Cohnella sp. CFH 77786 TaxID=2662265 RepID=UPI001C6110E0|nr:DUF3900 domain-containing protein [Cohnella sp. CFH 77786]MBW5446009.1 DUF3900 domain-containing protein [Cohnella sp. CFH 77786]
MKFSVQYLSFFVIRSDASETDTTKRYKHYQTLTHEEYQDSELKAFLDGEFARIGKRKADINPASEAVPTKIGRFMVEPGHELTSNPNYNLFQRIRTAPDKPQFHAMSDDLIRIYMEASAVRGGAFIVALAKLNELFDDPLLFLLKCDFENKIARISDERSLITKVEMAINARNIKSIMYPHMPEPGMLEEWELKIHQASHARYFEDFLKYVSYEKSKPEIVSDQVAEMFTEYIETKWPEAAVAAAVAAEAEEAVLPSGAAIEEMEREKKQFELWSASEKRELQQLWAHERVLEAAARLTAYQPELELKLKLAGVSVRGHMADYGKSIHLASHNGRFVVLIEGDNFEFERGVSPVELLQPDDIAVVLERMKQRAQEEEEAAAAGGYADGGPEAYGE